ncbi:MAG: homocysteine S-methyltransferase family protein, partial [Chloroflexota bacterium]
ITFEHESKPDYVKLQADFDEQAKIIADSGADFFMLEMMNHIERTQICYDAAAKTGLPVIVGFNVWENHEGEIQLGMHHYPPGRPTLAEGIQALPDDVPMITVMHSLTTDIPAALDVIHANYDGPSGVYAHWGKFVMPSWQFDGMISAQAYADEAEKWAAAGTQLIGGCCGISPVHIQELTKRFR